jgi:hypothetical protein
LTDRKYTVEALRSQQFTEEPKFDDPSIFFKWT